MSSYIQQWFFLLLVSVLLAMLAVDFVGHGINKAVGSINESLGTLIQEERQYD